MGSNLAYLSGGKLAFGEGCRRLEDAELRTRWALRLRANGDGEDFRISGGTAGEAGRFAAQPASVKNA